MTINLDVKKIEIVRVARIKNELRVEFLRLLRLSHWKTTDYKFLRTISKSLKFPLNMEVL